MRFLRSIFCICLVAATSAAVAQGAPVPRNGTPYSAARGFLMAKGYRPIPAGGRDEARCSSGRQDVCAAYPETISCSGTGAAPCRFIFSSPSGTALTIIAEGRDAGRLRVTAARRSSKEDVAWQRAGRKPD